VGEGDQFLDLEYSTNGTTWSNSTQQIYGPFGASVVICYDVKIYDSGSDLKIFVVLTDSNYEDLIYIRGSLGDSDSIQTWDSYQTIDAALEVQINSDFACAIARTDNGRLVVAFTEDDQIKGVDYRLTKIIGSDGDGAAPTWSSETTIHDPTSYSVNEDKGDVYMGMESFDSTYPNRVLIYGKVPQQSDVGVYETKAWTYEWNGSSMTVGTTYNTGAHADEDKVISAIIDDSDYIHLLFF